MGKKKKNDFDEVEKPYHYNIMGKMTDEGRSVYEPINIIESWGWGEGFCCGNAIKYILRAPHKGTEEADLKKAHWYLCKTMESRGATGWRLPPEEFTPMLVAQAWKLPGRLQMAIESIAEGNCGWAINELVLYLNELRAARETAEEIDEGILSDIEATIENKSHVE